MRVCIDIQSAIAQRAGVGRYTKALVEQIGAVAEPADELTLFYFDFKRVGTPFPVSNADYKSIQWLPGRLVQKAWKSIGQPPFNWFAGSADVYHFPNFVIPPLTRGRSIVTIHDVSFLRHPEAAEPKNLRYLNAQIRRTIAHADHILTDSQFSADEICELLAVDEERVQAIHLGLTPNLRAPAPERIESMRETLDLRKPYLLFVSTLEPRKNIPFLIDSFARLSSFDGELVIAGMRGWKFEPILKHLENSPARDRIRYLEYVDEAWLPALYAGAELFLFPSLYEGFGFPPLEAMQCGTPVVSSRAGSLPEVLGSAAHYVDIADPQDWADAIEALLHDTTLSDQYRQDGTEQAAKFRWTDTARKTWAAYREVGE